MWLHRSHCIVWFILTVVLVCHRNSIIMIMYNGTIFVGQTFTGYTHLWYQGIHKGDTIARKECNNRNCTTTPQGWCDQQELTILFAPVTCNCGGHLACKSVVNLVWISTVHGTSTEGLLSTLKSHQQFGDIHENLSTETRPSFSMWGSGKLHIVKMHILWLTG